MMFCNGAPPGLGLVSVAVFSEERRPCGSARNVAMVYCVGARRQPANPARRLGCLPCHAGSIFVRPACRAARAFSVV